MLTTEDGLHPVEGRAALVREQRSRDGSDVDRDDEPDEKSKEHFLSRRRAESQLARARRCPFRQCGAASPREPCETADFRAIERV